MLVKFTGHLLLLIVLTAFTPAGAAGLDDADQRLFRVQLSIAEKGDAQAQYYLGEMHEQGLGTEQNINEAFKWYAKAAERGDRMAKRKLEHRAEIEAEIKKEQMIDIPPKTPEIAVPDAVRKPSAAKKPAAAKKEAPAVMAQSDVNVKEIERLKEIERTRAAEREKRRTMVRAILLERMRNPGPGLFE
ncbi:MAG: SEL1-like repeat protein [Sulfuricaulis sp.]|nr:SEL1-like repeat protein [Sulfuricaulis sp.]